VFGNTDIVSVQAAASDDGSVTNVQFFDGTNSLGKRSSSPFSVSTSFPLGLHTLTAVASDNLGASTTSAPVHVLVARYLPALTNGDIALLLLPAPALDIQSRVQPPLIATNANDERGFLGLAFHPGYTNPASPGFRTLYTYNSEQTNGTLVYPAPSGAVNNYRNVVNEWKISTTNASVV